METAQNKIVKAALLGAGTVGSGVYQLVQERQEDFSHICGTQIQITKILVRDASKEREGIPSPLLTDNWNEIIEDDSISIIIEVMGGIEPAKSYLLEAMKAGKQIVTANKDLIAEHGHELLDSAEKYGCDFKFEAAVAGCVPIIQVLKQSMSSENITEVMGIVNGTTNYILSKMTDEGKSFEEVLKRAQEKGYAERNPEADVEGYDACRKIAILTSLALGKQVDYRDIYTEGITKITKTDIEYAKALHASIKLLGTSKWEDDGKIYSMVAPFMIDSDHPLGHVNGVFNGIFVNGNMLGDTMFYGKGAGKLPTASAVVADVVDAVKHQGTNIMTIWEQDKVELGDRTNFACRFFVRVADTTSKETIEKVFGEVEYVTLADVSGEYAFLTEKLTEGAFEEKSKQVDMIMRIRTAL